jgi:hypothetical protein
MRDSVVAILQTTSVTGMGETETRTVLCDKQVVAVTSHAHLILLTMAVCWIPDTGYCSSLGTVWNTRFCEVLFYRHFGRQSNKHDAVQKNEEVSHIFGSSSSPQALSNFYTHTRARMHSFCNGRKPDGA